MTIGVYSFDIHLPGSQSLKDKRMVLRRLKDRLRARHNVAVVETGDHASLWQRGGLIVVSIASHRDVLARLFETVHREAEQQVPGSVIETGREFLDASEAAWADWDSDAAQDESPDDEPLER